MCFSATIPPKIQDVLSHVLNQDHVSISTLDASEPPTIAGVPQFSVIVPKAANIFGALLSLIKHEIDTSREPAKIIVFGVTANLVALYADLYRGLLSLPLFEMQSRLNQNARTEAADAFREAKTGIMFATDGKA